MLSSNSEPGSLPGSSGDVVPFINPPTNHSDYNSTPYNDNNDVPNEIIPNITNQVPDNVDDYLNTRHAASVSGRQQLQLTLDSCLASRVGTDVQADSQDCPTTVAGPPHPSQSSTRQNSTHENAPSTSHEPGSLPWNTRGFWRQHSELLTKLASNPPIVIAIQEAMTNRFNGALWNMYTWYSSDNQQTRSNGIVTIGVLNCIPHQQVSLRSDIKSIGIRITSPIKVTIVNVYVEHAFKHDELSAGLSSLLEGLEPPYLIAGDFNARHAAWDPMKTNQKGRIVLNWIIDEQLNLLNDGSPTRICDHSCIASAIDLTLASNSLANRLSWKVDPDPINSDHLPISTFLDTPLLKLSTRQIWRYKDADWSRFEELLKSKISSQSTFSVEQLTDHIFDAAVVTIPRSSLRCGSKNVVWWNSEVEEAVRARRKALRKARKLSGNEQTKMAAMANFRKIRNQTRRIIKQAKADSWEQFASSFNPQTPVSCMWQNFNRISGKKTCRTLRINSEGQFKEDPLDIAEDFAQYFANSSKSTTPDPNRNIANNNEVNRHNPCIDRDFTFVDLQRAINRCSGNSVGLDLTPITSVLKNKLRFTPWHIVYTTYLWKPVCLAMKKKKILSAANLNGYDKEFVHKILRKHERKKFRNNATTFKPEKEESQRVSLLFFPPLTNDIRKILSNHGLKVAYKSSNTLKDRLVSLKDKVPPEERSGIYEIPCETSPAVYIGQTRRKFKTRIKEHKNAVDNNKTNESSVAAHASESNNSIDWEKNVHRIETLRLPGLPEKQPRTDKHRTSTWELPDKHKRAPPPR
ncbi:uncharacterized protein LOC129742024 [Uranotaenia lowii]|uniref:uncharacterized protein LOC129742024 n=1 Tax=Uranotaenia lowii TaxID=190385 RepID=UPI00247A4570|nr:uncharacterized protein LOC129742024 [Uranotaenia lowii]